MTKFANRPGASGRQGIKTAASSPTYEGGAGFSFDAESELFLLAATYIPEADTFYEGSSARDSRFVDLIHDVTRLNPEFISGNNTRTGLATYLRSEMKMRSAPIVLACEYVRAGGKMGRRVVDSVCQRPDEPAEILGYWLSTYGRSIPEPIKRGVAAAARRMYTEKNIIRYDGARDQMRFADVIELTHPKPGTPYQGKLFGHLLDERHHASGNQPKELFYLLSQDWAFQRLPADQRRRMLESIPKTWSWERLAGWLPGGMDAEAWDAVIPNMGVMALLRNLRNFDQAGISDPTIDMVISRLTDPEEIRFSRIWPHHVWLAYREAPSDNWKRALARTFELSTPNVTRFQGRTLILCDVSQSMNASVGGARSTLMRSEIAATLSGALAKEQNADVVAFATTWVNLPTIKGSSAMRTVQAIMETNHLGSGTNIQMALQQSYAGQDRVILLTDMQATDSPETSRDAYAGYYWGYPRQMLDAVKCPVYSWDLAGYGRAHMKAEKNRFFLTGWSDSMLEVVGTLERGHNVGWPF